MQEKNLELEQEISMRDCADIIIKRKKLISLIFLVSVITIAVITYFAPKTYEVSMIIRPPVLGVSDSGSFIFADLPPGIKLTQEPRVSATPAGSSMMRNVVFTGILSLMAGILAAFFMEFRQNKVR